MKIFKFIVITIFYLSATAQSKKDNWAFYSAVKPLKTPIIKADSTKKFLCPIKNEIVKWQAADIFNPAAVVKDGKVYLFTRCEDNAKAALGKRTSRIGLAESSDGINFKHFDSPVLFPKNDAYKELDYPGGCEDPRVVETEDGRYVMLYTSWNYKVARMSVAFSSDLFHWEKKGLAFGKAYDNKFYNLYSKSGSIWTKMIDGKPIAVKVNGKYWMYWGEEFVNLAWSENLYDWYPLLDEKKQLKKIMTPRKGYFDSKLTECGPPALITDKGILLLYNGKNAENNDADPNLAKGVYAVGQALFDLNNPEKILKRSEKYLLKPSLPHEITGQYAGGTTFAEGLVKFKGKWMLYYGTADSFVGVAVLSK
jgi:beta-1,2-mannosidase